MPGATPDQPGWYPDDNGTMRWFDGNAWTDHVQPGAAPGAEPTAVESGGPEPTRPLEQSAWQAGPPPSGPPPSSPPPSGPPPSTPPPSGPPSGAPYGAVPSAPSGPGGPGDQPNLAPPSFGGGGGGNNKVLLILLAIVGAIVLIAVIAVGAWAIFGGDDDDDGGKGRGGAGSSLPDTTPEEVAEEFMAGVQANDCEKLEDLVTERLIEEEGACDEVSDMPSEFTYQVKDAEIDEDAETARVPVELSFQGLSEMLALAMVVVDDEWKIDEFIEGEGGQEIPTDLPTLPSDLSTDAPTDIPTDIPTDFTDFPTGLPTEFPTDFLTDPTQLESYLSDYFSDLLTFTG